MVKLIVGNIYSKVVGFLPEEIQIELDKKLSYKLQGAKFIPSVKDNRWDGVIRLYYRAKGQSFLTGLLAIVREVLKKNNIEYEILDNREKPLINYPELVFKPSENYQERDYQNITVPRALQFTRGVLNLCTGAGKTLIVTRLIGEIKTYPFIFYVLTKDLMEQAYAVMSEYLNQPIGMIGDGKCDIKKISVCTIQTAILALNDGNTKFKISDYSFDDQDSWDEKGIESSEKAAKIRKLIQMANGIYIDECHHVSSRTARDVFLASPNAYWRFGGSATPNRESGDDIMIQALLGSKIVEVSASYLIKRGWLVKPYVFFDPIQVDTKLNSYHKIYDTCVVKNDKFNTHVADMAKHLVSKGLSVLILVQRYAQGDYIKTLIPDSEFVTGKVNSKKRTEIIENLRNGTIKTMIATSLADEGLDIPNLDAVLIAGGGKSSTRLFQRIGRTLRKDKEGRKTKSIVVIYEHSAKYLIKHVQRVRSLLKREPEFIIQTSKGPDFICEEMDVVLGFKDKQTDLFNS